MVTRPRSRAASSARNTFGERPEVEMARNTSPGPPKPAHLPLEHMLEAVIVSHRGQHGRVGGERQRRQWPPVDQIAREKFGGEMLSISSAATIAGDQELATGAHGHFDRVRDVGDELQQRGILGRGLQSDKQIGRKSRR